MKKSYSLSLFCLIRETRSTILNHNHIGFVTNGRFYLVLLTLPRVSRATETGNTMRAACGGEWK